MIELNSTFFIQFVNFVLILILLNVILIGPIRRILKKRAEHMAGQMDAIEKFAADADGKMKNYESALDEARKDAVAVRMELKDAGLAKEKELLGAAGQVVAEELKAARAEISSQAGAAKSALTSGVDALAGKAVGKILGGAA
jgi:F-type H+-transporting ATPase subunit b